MSERDKASNERETSKPRVAIDNPLSLRSSTRKPESVTLNIFGDFGEAVAGTTADYVVARPIVRDPSQFGTMSAAIVEHEAPMFGYPTGGANPFHLVSSPGPYWYLSVERSDPIVVRFSPPETQLGHCRATLRLQIIWASGVLEVRDVPLHATARHISNLPSKNQRSQQSSDKATRDNLLSTTEDLSQPATRAELAFGDALGNLSDEFRDLGSSQKDGISAVESEVSDFKRTPPPPSILEILAESIISVGIAGIAGALSRGVRPHAQKVMKYSGDDKAMDDGFADGVKEVVKRVGNAGMRRGIDTIKGWSKSSKNNDYDDGQSVSANPRAQFFAMQKLLCDAARDELVGFASDERAFLQPVVSVKGINMAGLVDAMRAAVKDERQSGRPMAIQAQASRMGWVRALAVSSMGSDDDARTVDGKRPAVASTLPRTIDGDTERDGLLTIGAEMRNKDLRTLKVTGATMNGVSNFTARKFLTAPPHSYGFPIAIVLRDISMESQLVTLTIDEGGRVRFNGEKRLLATTFGREVSEHEALPDAEIVARRIIGVSLESHGVDIIATDDVGAR